MKRPFWVIGCTFLIASLCTAWMSVTALLFLLVAGVIALILAVVVPSLRRPPVMAVLLSCITVLGLLFYRQVTTILPLTQQDGNTVTLCLQAKRANDLTTLTVLSGDLPAGTTLSYWCATDDLLPEPYELIEGSFTLHTTKKSGLARLSQQANGTWIAVSPAVYEDNLAFRSGDRPLFSPFEEARARMINGVNQSLSGDVAAVVSGICLGADSALSAEAENAFRTAGVSHLFAVSGFHLLVIVSALQWLLRRCRAGRFLRAALTVLFVLLFIFLIGATPSIVRAGVVCLLVYGGTCFKRRADTCNSLGLALFILLLIDPFAAYDVGLLLSFCATFGLVFLVPRLKSLSGRLLKSFPPLGKRIGKTVLDAFFLALCALTATAPVSALFFGQLSVVSLIANLLVTLPATVLLILGFPACLLSLILPAGALSSLFFPAGMLARYLLEIAQLLSSVPYAVVQVREPFLLFALIGGILLLFAGYRLLGKKGVRIAAGFAVLSVTVSGTLYIGATRDVMRLLMIPTTHGTTICVYDRSGSVLLCDETDAGSFYTVRTALRTRGITSLQTVLYTADDIAAKECLEHILEPCLSDKVCFQNCVPETGITLLPDTVLSSTDVGYELMYRHTLILIMSDNARPLVTEEERAYPVIIYRGDIPFVTGYFRTTYAVVGVDHRETATAAKCGATDLKIAEQEGLVLSTRGEGDISFDGGVFSCFFPSKN